MASEIEEIRQKKMNEIMQDAAARSADARWPDGPVPISDSDFEEFIAKYPKVVVDCWAPWCGPCRMLSPTIDALAKDHKGKIAYGKLNTDDNFGTASKYRVMSIPTLLIFKDGKLVDKMIGAAPRPIVEQNIIKTLG